MTRQSQDSFRDIARYYDTLMDHVNYDRWKIVAGQIASLLPSPVRHLDAACGTGVLLRKLQDWGWNSMGLDLSFAMLKSMDMRDRRVPVMAADLRAFPLREEAFNFVTCLFDSINFLLTLEDVTRALSEIARVLQPGGLVYFDAVTERMVLEHFADQEWSESNGSFSSSWSTCYDRKKRISEMNIRINRGQASTLYERMYTPGELENAIRDAGLSLLGMLDAETWGPVRPRKTVRVDFVAVNGDAQMYRESFQKSVRYIRSLMKTPGINK